MFGHVQDSLVKVISMSLFQVSDLFIDGAVLHLNFLFTLVNHNLNNPSIQIYLIILHFGLL